MSGTEILISGSIDELIYPSSAESFVDFAVVRVANRKLKGRLPFLDFNFIYHMWCREEKEKKTGKTILAIVRMAKPAYTPLPLTIARLRRLIIESGEDPLGAEAICGHLQSTLSTQFIDFNNISAEKLLVLLKPTPNWLIQLAKTSVYFRFPFIAKLTQLWSLRDLQQFSVPELCAITLELSNNLENFAYSFKSGFNLPELRWPALKEYAILNRIQLDSRAYARISIYENVQRAVLNEQRLALSSKTILGWGFGAPAQCVPKAILKPVHVISCKTKQGRLRWIAANYIEHMQVIGHRLREIMEMPHDGVPLRSKPPRKLKLLNEKQREVYELALQQNFMLVLGDAGTGKSMLASYLLKTFKKDSVLPLAYYGRVASNFRATCEGKGMTIHKMMELLKRGGNKARRLVRKTKVVFIDEGSVLTLQLVRWVVELLPNIHKLIIFGDPKQMAPPSPGPIFNSLIDFYQSTRIVQTLQEIMRTDKFPGAGIMKDNSRRIAAGLLPEQFTGVISEDGCPWIILPRKDVLPHELRSPMHRETRVRAMVETLQPLVKYFSDKSLYQLMAQKNDTCSELNDALHRLYIENGETFDTTNSHSYKVNSKIVFTTTTYGNVPILPQDAEARAAMLASPEYFLRTCPVMNGDTDVVTLIEDCDPVSNQRLPCASTTAAKVHPGWQRIITLRSGRQVNLSFYALSNIAGGDAITVASLQGSEIPAAAVYIQQGFSKYFTRDQLYTAVTRGRRFVIIFCGSLEELQTILNTVLPKRDNVLSIYLPKATSYIPEI